MPVQVSYPRVYVEEIPSGLRTITAVATSISALIAAAPREPMKKPTEIFSFADSESIFGGLNCLALRRGAQRRAPGPATIRRLSRAASAEVVTRCSG